MFMNLFNKPNYSISRIDKNELTLKDVIAESKDKCDVSLAGIPFDGATFGRPGARYAPKYIREHLLSLNTYSYEFDFDLSKLKILDFGDIKVRAVHAYNVNKFRSPGVVFHPKEDNKVGYVVKFGEVEIYHAGDTDHIPEMKDLKPTIALLPVSGTYVMTKEEAIEAAKDINPKVVIPMHYGTIVGSEADAVYLKGKLPKGIELVILKPE